MSDELWSEMQQTIIPAHPLERDTALYSDVRIALRVFFVRYPEYMRQTTPWERMLYRMYLALESRKELHQHEQSRRKSDMQRLASMQAGPRLRTSSR